MFLCRNKELEFLNKKYNEDNFECIIIYGRRRVGKTALIKEFCKDKPAIFFSALDTTSKENLAAISESIAVYEGEDSYDARMFSDFDAALKKITKLGQNQRLVLVIDEYPYLAKSESSISSRLQHIIDHQWQNTKLFVILCGSSMSFMANQVLGYQSPLYGRRTGQCKIKPLDYYETSMFYPKASLEEKALIYGITGGIPLYILRLEYKNKLSESIISNVLDTSSFLFEEPNNLLKQELREPAIYNSIIGAIATGASRLNEISTKTDLQSAICSKYLDTLMELGIVFKETPLGEKQGRRSYYYLSDNFFRFWYRFIPKALSAINMGISDKYYQVNIAPQLSHYMGLVFEQMCKEYLGKQEKDGFYLTNIGQWWGSDPKTKKQVQIDIVASTLDEDTYVVASCKYKNEPIGMDELETLKAYANVFNPYKKYKYYLFSKSGFTDNLKKLEASGEVTLVSLEDMYKK